MKKDMVQGTDYIIYQDDNNFKYTFDSLALSSFIKAKGVCVDLGAGFGIMGFRIVDKAEKVINIDINEDAIKLLEISTIENKLEDKVVNIVADVNNIDTVLKRQTADVVFTNPPYFDSGLQPAQEKIKKARHSNNLIDFFNAANNVLKNSGKFYAVLPVDRLVDAIYGLKINNIEPRKIVFLKKNIDSESRRFLIEGIKSPAKGMKIIDLVLYEKNGTTEEYKKIYRNERIG